jgi:pyrroline-5-carboxylate reductase
VTADARSIAFIGPGVMAEAILGRLLERGDFLPASIRLAGPRAERLAQLQERYQVGTTTENRAAVQSADLVVLCVKPQTLPEAMRSLEAAIPEGALVLSIVAGASLRSIVDGLRHRPVIRAMPNTPAQVGAGITVWTATPEVTPSQRGLARSILAALGQELEVDEEDYLDMATALSGTGPAYVYLFMEALIDAGVHLGFPRRIAEQLVRETIRGSLLYYEQSPSHPARLRNQVTSPGGTSAEALYYLEKAGLRTALARAIWAAYDRSVELGRGSKRGSREAD